MMSSIVWLLTLLSLAAASDPNFQHKDSRCLCKCPDVATVKEKAEELILEAANERSVYVNSSVSPQDCTCQNVVLVHVNMTPAEADSFCPRCKCDYQTRNLTVIKVVVILVVWVIAILMVYTAFLTCLDPLINRGRANNGNLPSYNHQVNEEDEQVVAPSPGPSSSTDTPMSHYGHSVINRVNSQQSRWKRQVQEQRRNIYDRHAMLN